MPNLCANLLFPPSNSQNLRENLNSELTMPHKLKAKEIEVPVFQIPQINIPTFCCLFFLGSIFQLLLPLTLWSLTLET